MSKSDARRADILATAWKVFLEHGYGAASMSDIAARVGGSKTTLYNYFRSKEELFLAAVRNKGDEFHGELSKLLEPSDDLRDDLIRFAQRLLRIVALGDYMPFYRVMIFEAVRFPMIGKLANEGRRLTVLEPVGERLRQEMEKGRLRSVDPMEAAEVFWDLCSASFNWHSILGLNEGIVEPRVLKLIEQRVAVFLAAYGVDGGDFPAIASMGKKKSTSPRPVPN